MMPFPEHAAELSLLAFLAITFLQSGTDKILDWKGNLQWLTPHFSKTPFKRVVPVLLAVLLLTETAAGFSCVLGILELLIGTPSGMALVGAVLGNLALLMLLFVQRIAKDYDGARTVVIYFVPAVFLLFLLQP